MSGTATYVQRQIGITVQLGTGTFGESGANTVTLPIGLRVVATIQKLGPPGAATADIQVYGMTPDVMNTLSTLGAPIGIFRNNQITVTAGDAINGMAVVFKGLIRNAWQNLDSQPDVFFNFIAQSNFDNAMKPATPLSVNSASADVATLMNGLATQMSRTFENNAVTAKIAYPYYAGTALEQAQALARDANIEMFDDGTTLAIWPKNGGRQKAIPTISPATGLIGYPQFQDQGMKFRSLFNPSIQFGNFIQMQSSIQPACGRWYVNKLSYNLSCQLVNGPWFCDVGCTRWVAPAA